MLGLQLQAAEGLWYRSRLKAPSKNLDERLRPGNTKGIWSLQVLVDDDFLIALGSRERFPDNGVSTRRSQGSQTRFPNQVLIVSRDASRAFCRQASRKVKKG